MSTSDGYVENICTKCWGRGSVIHNRGTTGEYSELCPRCKGTGEEPDTFNWPVYALCIIIFIVGLYFVWSIK